MFHLSLSPHPSLSLYPSLLTIASNRFSRLYPVSARLYPVSAQCWYCCIHIYTYTHIYIYMLDTYRRNDNRRKNKGRRKEDTRRLLYKYIYLSIYCKVRKGCWRFACERVLETEHKLHILTPLLWPSRCVFLVLLMLGSTLSGLSEGPLGRVWPSLPHLVSSCLEVCWQLLWDSNTTELNNNSTPTRSPTGSLNRMFNRHQAEITVMQFRGYSLPVHHCSGTMGPSPCPIS